MSERHRQAVAPGDSHALPPGTVYGVGLGPGDPELITLKGLRLLQAAARVFVPATAAGRSLARRIAAPYLDPDRQPVIELVCPPLRDRTALLARWRELASEVAKCQRDGGDAVFLTEGDPSLFSTFQYLAGWLRSDYDLPVVVVPGVSSVSAAAALAARPLAMWDERLAILPATAGVERLAAALTASEQAVILKPGGSADAIAAALAHSGASWQLTLVRRVGLDGQALVTGPEALAALVDGAGYFSLLLATRYC